MSDAIAKKQEILDAFQFRFATKEYDGDRKISEEDFKFILEAGRLSPSSYGLEPWKFLIIQNPDFRERLMKIATGAARQLRGASHFIIILARTDVKFDSEYIIHHIKTIQQASDESATMLLQSLESFQHRWRLFENERALLDWSSKQTYIALANMLTAAAQIGIDSTPIEGFSFDEVNSLLESEGLLDNGTFKPSVMAAFGYRKEDPIRPKTRKNLSDIVEWV
ncbi:putative NAD(P)H nitroreductase YfkO [compost metagenome]